MTCEEFNAMLDNYENLTDEEKLELNEHTSGCEACREELDFMLAIVSQLNTLPEIETPPDFRAKLNARLDAEGAGAWNKMFTSLRQNYRRYSAVAACLVLAVIIGANGKTFLNRLPSDTDTNVVVTEGDGVPKVSDTAADKAEQPIAGNDRAVSADNGAAADDNGLTKTPQKIEQVAQAKKSGSESMNSSIVHIRDMSESIKQIKPNPTDRVSEPVYEDNGISVLSDENAGIAIASIEGEQSVETEAYTIARGVYRLPDVEIAKAELEGTSPDENRVLQIAEMNSKGGNEATIARGRYYIPADEGYIEIYSNNAIGVNSADAQRAEEVIKEYADVVDDSYYVISSDNISSMLERMDGEGINYQNNVENADNAKVSFKLVIE